MTEVPEELEGVIDSMVERVSEEVSETVADELLADLTTELSPKLVQELRGGKLESLSPSAGIAKFRKKKRKEVQESTLEQHSTKLEYLEEYLAEVVGLENLNDLTPRQAEEYEEWREFESLDREKPLAGKTLKDDIHLYKGFLGHMVKLRAVSADAYEVVEIPNLETGEGVDKETLDSDRAGDIIDHLNRFRYASREHVVWLLFVKTGRRACDLYALDLGDFDDSGEKTTLEFVNRPQQGSRLKKGELHEAEIELSEAVSTVIREYIEHERLDVTDSFDREPLLTTKQGRASKSTMKEYAYKWSRPCEVGKDCPYDKDVESCVATSSPKKASQCEASRSPRKIRSGYITSKANAGAAYESIGHRVGATKSVMKKHYDQPDRDEERQRHTEEIRQSNSSEESGYANEE